MSVRDRLQRRVIPRAIVALSTIRLPGRIAAALRRAAGGKGTVKLFVAFDDPYSAIALLGLADLTGDRRVRLLVEPVVARGIPDDPAVEAKRRYAVTDSKRLARRGGLELRRLEPVPAEAAAFLADWAGAIPQGSERTVFCVAAMRRLWFQSEDGLDPSSYAGLWPEHRGAAPPADGAHGSEASEREMRRRRLYDTPIAVVHGQWFFAHERLEQIGHRLDQLGWVAR